MRSQNELAQQISVSREIVGRYERDDAVPSIDIVKRMADAFEVSLDYMVGASEKQINKEMLNRIEEVDKMNRARELTSLNTHTFIWRALPDHYIKIMPDKPGRKKDGLHLSGCV